MFSSSFSCWEFGEKGTFWGVRGAWEGFFLEGGRFWGLGVGVGLPVVVK